MKKTQREALLSWFFLAINVVLTVSFHSLLLQKPMGIFFGFVFGVCVFLIGWLQCSYNRQTKDRSLTAKWATSVLGLVLSIFFAYNLYVSVSVLAGAIMTAVIVLESIPIIFLAYKGYRFAHSKSKNARRRKG